MVGYRVLSGLACVVIAAMIGGATLIAQQPAGAPSSDSVKVHGDWTIDIREPDGTLVKRHEFKNALDSDGQDTLGQLLTGGRVIGKWGILLSAISAAHPCISSGVNSGIAGACFIVEPGGQFPSVLQTGPAEDFPNLTVTRDGGQIVLAGQATAGGNEGSTRHINQVETKLGHCAASSAPCEAAWSTFTVRALTSVISVSPGQIIQVRVVISFS